MSRVQVSQDFSLGPIPYFYKDLVVGDENDAYGILCMSSIASTDDDAVEHSPNMD